MSKDWVWSKWFIGETCGTDIEDVIFLELESEKCTLCQIINLIEKSELMSKENLSFLKQMNEKRIYYCHKCFLKFYKHKIHHSPYKKLLNLLTKDLEKFKNLYKEINNLRYQNS